MIKMDFLLTLLPQSGIRLYPTLKSIHLLQKLCKTHTARIPHWMHHTRLLGVLPSYPSETQRQAESSPIPFSLGAPDEPLLCSVFYIYCDWVLFPSLQNEKTSNILLHNPIYPYNSSICLLIRQHLPGYWSEYLCLE